MSSEELGLIRMSSADLGLARPGPCVRLTMRILAKLSRPLSVKLGVPSSMKVRSER